MVYVQKAVKAFLYTDPYWPRPLAGDEYVGSLWQTSARRYKERSPKLVMGITCVQLLDKFIEDVIAELRSHQSPSSPQIKCPVAPKGLWKENRGRGSGREKYGGNMRGDWAGSGRGQGNMYSQPGFGSPGGWGALEAWDVDGEALEKIARSTPPRSTILQYSSVP